MSYKPNLTAHMPAASLNATGCVHPPSTSRATSSQYRQLLSDYGPPSLGYTQGTGNSQVPQSKYAELLAIIEELGKEIRPTYAGSKSAMERLKRGIIHARGLVRECLAETERNARSYLPCEPGRFSSFFPEEKLRFTSLVQMKLVFKMVNQFGFSSPAPPMVHLGSESTVSLRLRKDFEID